MIKEHLKHEEQNAINAPEFVRSLGFTTKMELHQAVNKYRSSGEVILSSGAGFFLPSEDNWQARHQIERFIASLSSRALPTLGGWKLLGLYCGGSVLPCLMKLELDMETGKRSIVLYVDLAQHVRHLPPDEAGAVFLAILEYGDTGKLPDLTGAAGMCFSFIRAQLDRDEVKWKETRAKRTEYGRTGGIASGIARKHIEANEAKASTSKQTQANKPVNVNVPVNGNDTVNETVTSKREAKSRFTPPSLDGVRQYIKDNGYPDVDAERFFAYYAASDWHDKDGKPVKNWQQKIISWSGRDLSKKGKSSNGTNAERDYSTVPNGYASL